MSNTRHVRPDPRHSRKPAPSTNGHGPSGTAFTEGPLPPEVVRELGLGVPQDVQPPSPQPTLADLFAMPLAMAANVLVDLGKTTLSQVPARSPFQCHACHVARGTWQQQHQGELRAALAVACEKNGLAEGDPRAAQLDLVAFLPPNLQPGGAEGLPVLYDGTVMVGGTLYCPGHAPGVPGAQQGSGLILMPGIGQHEAARFAATLTAGVAGR